MQFDNKKYVRKGLLEVLKQKYPKEFTQFDKKSMGKRDY